MLLLSGDDVIVLSTTFDGTNTVGPVCGCKYAWLLTSVFFFPGTTLLDCLTTFVGLVTCLTLVVGIFVRLTVFS